jgi:hypothetical protein
MNTNHELIDVRITTVPFWQINEIKNAIRAIRTYEYIISENLKQYKNHTCINPIDITTTMTMENLIGTLENLKLYNKNYYESLQRNRDLHSIEQTLLALLPSKEI